MTWPQVLEAIKAHAARVCASGIRLVNGVDSGIAPTKDHGNAWIAVGDLVRADNPGAGKLARAGLGLHAGEPDGGLARRLRGQGTLVDLGRPRLERQPETLEQLAAVAGAGS